MINDVFIPLSAVEIYIQSIVPLHTYMAIYKTHRRKWGSSVTDTFLRHLGVHLRFLFSFVSWLSWSNFSKVWCIHSENHKQNHQMSCSVHYFNPQCCPLFLLISLAVPSWILLGTFSIPGSKAARPVNRLAIWPVNFSPLFLLGKRRHGWSPAVLSLNNLRRFNC